MNDKLIFVVIAVIAFLVGSAVLALNVFFYGGMFLLVKALSPGL